MLRRQISVSFLLLLLHIFSYGDTAHIRTQNVNKATCGYESCPKVDPKKLNVHLVAHTHDDVGWLKTVDQYYYGSNTRKQLAGVQYILDTVIVALRGHPERRFIYVETAYFWKWWNRQDEAIKEEVRSFINDGRLEIIGGGWSMNDEATTHYHSLVDQYTWGFRRLNDTLGGCARPKIGWQIDPFGHSREQASMFAQMGFDGMLFGRLDYQDKKTRLANKTAEFVWKASPSLGSAADLFTVAMYNTYSPPPGFCFDVLCSDDPMIDDPESPEYNIETRVELFRAFCEVQSRSYASNNIIITMGEDFNYQDAQMWFVNLDKLIRYTNQLHGSELNVFYSTPSCYLKALNDLNASWPTKSDDFFPYASDPHSYWTGYFSSRPTLKYFERMGNNFLQIVKQLAVLTNIQSEDSKIERFREAMGIMQHHDAVTGTEKQHVANDYARILHTSMSQGAEIVSEALGKWTAKEASKDVTLPKFHSCLLLNISACHVTEDNSNFVVTVYNPMSQTASPFVRIPVQGEAYSVKDPDGEEVTTQLVPVPAPVQKMAGRVSKATNELVFRADNVGPLGFRSFYVSEKPNVVEGHGEDSLAEISSIGGPLYNVTVNDIGNVEIQWINRTGIKLEQSFHYYEGAEGNNEVFENRSSGAYIFRPKNPSARDIKYALSKNFYKGPLVQELHLSVNDWVSQTVRIYDNQDRIEFHWMVGPIPTDSDKIGKEIITRYSSSLVSKGTFFTDSNAREMLERKKDYRPSWNLELKEPISGNYYPVTSKISLEDEDKDLRLSVLVDRAQGGSSLRDGEIELMLHRRLLKDDAFGVGEALNETAFGEGLIARGQHSVFVSDAADLDGSALDVKLATMELALRPWTLVTPANDATFEDWRNKYTMQGDGLWKKLPPNVQILTLEPWKENSILLRLEHVFEANEAATLSEPVTINIQDLFAPFTLLSIHETTLGGNQWIEDVNKLKWYPESNDIDRGFFGNYTSPLSVNDFEINVVMKPMEIRTFVIKVARK
ncbi:lysosomal alpha-mannosidase isoform X1 [Venturia canescens]|uniref:lysosomal alpha-mannosidase isoform X1 n=1 Tax=Venturia canescens TaxID=32260 RepID=UPI001C9D4E21|nr:lysosomal alpha-mannosidase isoform X1 [Venturia canescens]